LFRADIKAMWSRAPWRTGATIWFAPRLEAAFAEDCQRAGVSLPRTAPVVVNNLRWAWWRSRLNRDDPEGWHRALDAACRRQSRIGEAPVDYLHQPPSLTPPADARIKVVTRRAHAFEPARTKPLVDRATRAKARRPPPATPETPPGFDWRAFFQLHWADVFRPLWRAHRLDSDDVDGEVGRLLAIAWKDNLDEQDKTGRAVGPAERRWAGLLHQLGQGIRPGEAPVPSRSPRQIPPIASTSSARPGVVDAEMQALFDRVLRES
jgi:hypothetical protein